MSIQRRTSLVEQTKEFLKKEIIDGKFPPGSRLESIRQLTARLGVSHMTVVTSLQELAGEGWIETRPGSGSVVRRKEAPETSQSRQHRTEQSRIYFFFTRDLEPGSYHSEVLCSLQEFAEAQGWSMKIGMLTDHAAFAAAQLDHDAIAIVHASYNIAYAPGHIPIINYGMHPATPEICCVGPDNYQAGFLAGQLLWARGYRQAQFVSVKRFGGTALDYPDLNFIERYRGLSDYFRIMDVELPPPLPWSVPEQHCDAVETLLRQAKNHPAHHPILAVGNRVMATEIYRLALQLKMTPPRDYSIITFDCHVNSDLELPISTIDFSRQETGYQIGRLLQQVVAGHDLPNRLLLPMRFQDRGSIRTR